MKGFVYVLEWSTGVVKVGKSKAPDRRISGHIYAAEVFGVQLLRSTIVACVDHHHAEALLIEWVAQRSTKRIRKEWHFGVSYDEVVAQANAVAGITKPKAAQEPPKAPRRAVTLREYLSTPGQAARLARAVGVSKQAMSQWKARGVPIDRIDDVESATNGAVTALDLMQELRNLRAPA